MGSEPVLTLWRREKHVSFPGIEPRVRGHPVCSLGAVEREFPHDHFISHYPLLYYSVARNHAKCILEGAVI